MILYDTINRYNGYLSELRLKEFIAKETFSNSFLILHLHRIISVMKK